MTTTVEVNVSVSKVKKKGDNYKGKFQFQQISPLDKIYVKKNGKIDAFKAPGELDVVLNWVSNAVEIDGQLYSANYLSPLNTSIWVTPGENSDPGPGDPAPNSGDHDIKVPDGTDKDRLTIKDRNDAGKKYKYALAVELDINGDKKLLIKDPKIINKSVDPRVAPKGPPPGSGNGPPPGTKTGY